MKKFAAAVIAATAVIALSACGSAEIPKASGPEETAETGSLPQDVTAPIVAGVEADETIAAMLPEGMSTIKVGSNLQSPPATFLAADGSTPIGFEIDLITAMGNRLGVDLDIQNMQFDTLISGLESKRVDLTIASMNDNATRQEAIDFVNYFNSGIAILVKKGNPDGINSPEDLCGTDTSAAPGSSQLAWAEAVSPEICPEGEVINVVTNQNDQQRLNDLKTGRAQSALNDLPNLTYIAQTSGNGEDFEVVDTPLIDGAPYGIGFNKASTELRDAIQASLQSLIDDGTYGQILEAWGLDSGAIESATVNAGE